MGSPEHHWKRMLAAAVVVRGAFVVCMAVSALAVFVACGACVRTAHGQTAREKDTGTCLLLIDVQEFYFPGGAMPLEAPEAAAANCKKLLDKFRGDGRLVVHVGHNASNGASFHTDAAPRDGEKVIMKNEVNAFKDTDLLEFLRKNGVQRLVICGMQTHMCVEAAVRAAHDFGFDCVLVGDACATRALKFGEKTIDAADVQASTLATLDGTYARVVDTETLLKSE
jgi:nicotinamidase-related amidase